MRFFDNSKEILNINNIMPCVYRNNRLCLSHILTGYSMLKHTISAISYASHSLKYREKDIFQKKLKRCLKTTSSIVYK